MYWEKFPTRGGRGGGRWEGRRIIVAVPHLQVTTMLGEALSQEELEDFMAEADKDGNGKIDYDEFCKMLLQE